MDVWLSTARFVEAFDGLLRQDFNGHVLRDRRFALTWWAAASCGIKAKVVIWRDLKVAELVGDGGGSSGCRRAEC